MDARARPEVRLVLCDAPCSSTGAMRRTPSMRWLIAGDVAEWREGADDAAAADPLRYSTAWGDGDGDGVFAEVDVDASGDAAPSRPPTDGSRGTRRDLSLPEIQRRILAKAAGLVRPNGGALVYATCSLLVEENESVRSWFDERFGDDFVPMPFEAHWPSAPDALTTGDADEDVVPRMTSRGREPDERRAVRSRVRAAPRHTAATVSSVGSAERAGPEAPTSWEEEIDDEAMVRWIQWNVPPCAR